EIDLMSWVMRAAPLYRQTCRHSAELVSPTPTIARTKDGRWIISQPVPTRSVPALIEFLERYGMVGSLRETWERSQATADPKKAVNGGRPIPGSGAQSELSLQCQTALAQLFAKFQYDDAPWWEAQEAGLMVSPLRRPEE